MIDVAALAHECGFGRIADELAALARPSLRLVRGGDGRSRVAGGSGSGGMRTFAEIALDELDPSVWTGPREGVLRCSCFQDPDHGGVDDRSAVEVVVVDEPAIEGVAVHAVPELTVPHFEAMALWDLGLEFDDWTAYTRFEKCVANGQGFEGPESDRVLGWPQHVQGDVFLDIDEVADLRLLLQVHGDFGDGGALYFALPAGDLEAGRFDRVAATAQTH